jgi:hypothetical protein
MRQRHPFTLSKFATFAALLFLPRTAVFFLFVSWLQRIRWGFTGLGSPLVSYSVSVDLARR